MRAKSSLPLKQPIKVGELLRRRLQETQRTSQELAEAVHVPPEYIDDLIAGRRRPPLPARTDLYERMTVFLRLSRNDLALCARAERAETDGAGSPGPHPAIGRQFLTLCEPETARELEHRRAKQGAAELTDLIKRLLEVTQGAVRRVLDDQIRVRIAAAQSGSTYPAMRLKVLEFLDATVDTLTAEDLAEFVRPRISLWDVDLETGVLRVVLRAPEPRPSHRRVPSSRGSRLRPG